MTITKNFGGEIVPLTEDELAEYNAKQQAWEDGADDRFAAVLREDRNKLLDDSDWTQMNDSPLTDEAKASWATYRTALRDLSTHENWPNLNEEDWPTKP